MSENLSGCFLPLGYHCIREWGGGGGGVADRTCLSQRQEASNWCASQCSSTQTSESSCNTNGLLNFFAAGVCEIRLSGI